MKIIVIRSNRKTVSLSVNDELNAVVRAPYALSEKAIDDFVRKNVQWLERAAERKRLQLERLTLSQEELDKLICSAKTHIPERVNHYSEIMGLRPSAVKITKAKKRFGSCSGKNSLCFSCYLMLYPSEAIDYVVVHELAHIKYHNHGKEFYELIKEHMPDYRQREKLLKKSD